MVAFFYHRGHRGTTESAEIIHHKGHKGIHFCKILAVRKGYIGVGNRFKHGSASCPLPGGRERSIIGSDEPED